MIKILNVVSKNSDLILNSLLILVFALLPIDNKMLPPLLIVLFLHTIFTFKKSLFYKNLSKFKAYIFPYIFFFLVLSISIIWTENFTSGLKNIEKRLLFVIAPFIFLCIQVSKKQVTVLFKVYVFSTLLLTLFFFIYGIVQYINIYSPSIKYPFYAFLFVFSTILEDFNVHRSYFSVSLLISFLIFLSNAFYVKAFRKVIIISFLSLAILLFQSKMATIILISFFFLLCFRYIILGKWKQKLISIITLFLTSISSFFIVRKRFDTMIFKLDNLDLIEGKGSTVERIQYYYTAKRLIKEEPVLGYGIGDVKDKMLQQIQELGYTELIKTSVGDPHNEFVNVLLIAGIPGLLAFLYLFYKLFYESIHYKNWLLLGISWTFFCSCLVESYLSRQGGIIPFIILTCILIVTELNKETLKQI